MASGVKTISRSRVLPHGWELVLSVCQSVQSLLLMFKSFFHYEAFTCGERCQDVMNKSEHLPEAPSVHLCVQQCIYFTPWAEENAAIILSNGSKMKRGRRGMVLWTVAPHNVLKYSFTGREAHSPLTREALCSSDVSHFCALMWSVPFKVIQENVHSPSQTTFLHCDVPAHSGQTSTYCCRPKQG